MTKKDYIVNFAQNRFTLSMISVETQIIKIYLDEEKIKYQTPV